MKTKHVGAKGSPLDHEPRWSHNEDQILICGYRNGLSAVALGEVLVRRNPKGIQRRCRQLGLTNNCVPKPWTDDEIKKVIVATAAGKNTKTIATELGRTVDIVRRKKSKLRKEGLIHPLEKKIVEKTVRSQTDKYITDEDLEWMERYRRQREKRMSRSEGETRT